MTTYFDDLSSKIDGLRREALCADDGYSDEIAAALDVVERDVVRDVTLCAEWPGCPENVRDAIHRSLLKFSPHAQPINALPQCPEYADLDALCGGLDTMASRLHTIFHDLGNLHLDDFNDDPRMPLWRLIGVGDDRRESMAEPNVMLWKKQIECYDEPDRVDAYARVGQRVYDYAIARKATPEQAEAKRAEALAALQGKE